MATSRLSDPRRLDVAAFAAAGASLAGEWPLAVLPRLAATCVPGSTPAAPAVTWRLSGEQATLPGAGVRAAVRIGADATLELECQRCLKAMSIALHCDRRLFFVEGEDAAAALDLDSEDDVLALEPALDVSALIEDELLLALPLVPRHEACPEPLSRPLHDEEDPVDQDSPFAVLAALRGGGKPA